MEKKGHILFLLLALCIWAAPLPAQNNGGAANPFDLDFRLDEKEKEQISAVVVEEEKPVGNPFDVAKPALSLKEKQEGDGSGDKGGPLIRIQREPDDEDVPKAWLLITFLPALLLLTLVAGVYRDKLALLYRSITNANILNLAYRDSRGRANPHSILLYIVAVLSYGILGTMLALGDYVGKGNYFLSLAVGLSISAAYMLFKYAGISVVANVFPNKKEMGRYLFMFGQFNHALGMLALAFGIFLAFSPTDTHSALIVAGVVVLGMWLAMRVFRGVQIAGEFATRNIFRFFAYLCTIELAPIVILIALLKRLLDF